MLHSQLCSTLCGVETKRLMKKGETLRICRLRGALKSEAVIAWLKADDGVNKLIFTE